MNKIDSCPVVLNIARRVEVQDPFPYLKSFDDFQLASDVYQNGRNIDHINAGLYMVKHNLRSHQLYDAWLQDFETR